MHSVVATPVTPVSPVQEQIANYKTVPQHLLYPEQQMSKLEQTFSPQVMILNFASAKMVLNSLFKSCRCPWWGLFPLIVPGGVRDQ